jgi:NADH dehydrogenase (ubiquinone) 1 alpha subcomplex subunit 9
LLPVCSCSLSRNFTFDDVHVKAAGTIARIASEFKVPRLVHVSHLNASLDTPSLFYASKARGEDAVRDAFPDATIVRPGPLYGYEDKLLNSIASASSPATRSYSKR